MSFARLSVICAGACAIAAVGAVALFQKRAELRPVDVVQAKLPDQWQKGWVTKFSSDGASVEGRFFSRATNDCREWTWSSAQGFKVGKAIPGAKGDVREQPKGSLKDWDKEHGWPWSNPGKKLGSHKAYFISPTSMSDNGSVVVGEYCRELESETEHEDATSGTRDGKDFSYLTRAFLWTNKTGLVDLGDFAAPVAKVETKEQEAYSCAISHDGKQIVIVADRLYLMKCRRVCNLALRSWSGLPHAGDPPKRASVGESM